MLFRSFLITTDNSCTNPVLPSAAAFGAGVRGLEFRNFLYATGGANADGAGDGLDRTREGYAEIIEMGTLPPGASPGSLTVHAATGVPTCGAALLDPVQGTPAAAVLAAILAPTGNMNGTGTLIHVATGNASGYNAVALSNLTVASILAAVANDTPNFNQATPVSVVVSNNEVYRSDWAGVGIAGSQAVSATMMHSNVLNEYVLDNVTRSQTDWVMTFPTKRAFVSTAAATTPFTNKFLASGACETISFSFFNREEAGATATGVDFSPLPPGSPASALCWESTVMSIRNPTATAPLTGTTSGVLASANAQPVSVTGGFQNGWANLLFTGTNATTTGLSSAATSNTTNVLTAATVAASQTFLGLPVVGFMVRTFQNTAVTCGTTGCFYGGLFPHKYLQSITPQP